MSTRTVLLPEDELERRRSAFEAAWRAGASVDLRQFVPERSSPIFSRLLAELIRVDIEFRSERGEATALEAYRPHAPELFADSEWVRDLAFEEYRQRQAAGESVNREEYRVRYGVEVQDWPEADRREPDILSLVPGDVVASCRILSELGRGAFGRVFLAEQLDLAGRHVAIKLSRRPGLAEPETLARLQHTHIVPVYSAAKFGRLQTLVMPYLGSTTLADAIAKLKELRNWPQSGSVLADTVLDRASRTRTSRPLPVAPAQRPATTLPIEELRKFSYSDAVLWIGWKLAEALAHAHDRGILHRDIKPANVLLTDDGLPMLLDFNLAANAGTRAGIGGTPAYMAPEQLAALTSGRCDPDPRADIYSLGLVLTELLAGSVPKPGQIVSLVRRHPRISPSLAAILRKCLAVAPSERYATARELADDLQRQLTNQPLLGVREPSRLERWRKWRSRHPVIASNTAIAACAAIGIFVLVSSLLVRERRLNELNRDNAAQTKWAAFQRDLPDARERFALLETGSGAVELDEMLERYGLLSRSDWARDDAIERLPAEARKELELELASLLQMRARLEPDPATAIRLNERAEVLFATHRSVPRSVWMDRFEFASRLGSKPETRQWHDRAATTDPDARDWYLSGLTALRRGDANEARKLLESAITADPANPWPWLTLGIAFSELAQDERAEGCFNAFLALEPRRSVAFYNRGLARHRLRRDEDAVVDFTRALELDPNRISARVERGISLQALNRLSEAEADFTAAIDSETPESRVWFLRAGVRTALGRSELAASDRTEGLRREPSDAVSWIVRAAARVAAGETTGALADLDAALKLQPRSYAAWMNRANLMDQHLHREAEAVAALDRLIEIHPQALIARSGRAVLLARLGRSEAARADAEHCLARNPEPFLRYQLAGAYARLATREAAHGDTAMRLLREALRAGAGYEYIGTDADLDPIRGRADFRETLAAVRVLAEKP